MLKSSLLTRVANALVHSIDSFVPPSAKDDIDAQRKCYLLAAMLLFGRICTICYLSVPSLLDGLNIFDPTTISAAVFLGIHSLLLHMLRRNVDYRGIAVALSSAIHIVLFIRCVKANGVYENSFAWYSLLPIYDTLMLGTSGGTISFSCVVAQSFIIYTVTAGRVNLDMLPFLSTPAGTLFSRLMLFACIFLLTLVFEHSRKTSSAALRGTLKAVEEANEQLRQATAAKTLFLSNISHELRTPLHGIIAMSADLLEMPMLDERARDSAQVVADCANHLQSLVSDVLDFERIESGKLELDSIVFDIVDEVAKVARMSLPTAAKKGVTVMFTHSLAVTQPLRIGDPVRLRQVVFNLVGNAVKFTPDGGSVTVDVSTSTAPAGVAGEPVRVSVRDTGIGIPSDRIGRLFQSFAQADASVSRQYGGTGLGLAISKRLVELMGGTIGCESTLGRGSCFWFVVNLPVAPPALAASAASADMPGGPLRVTEFSPGRDDILPPVDAAMRLEDCHVLVVEDNVVNQKVATRMLTSFGCRVSIANNGMEALEKVHAEGAFDVILLDVQMPILDGFETAKRLRELEQPVADATKQPVFRTPLIALSASATIDFQRRATQVGMDAFLTKPLRKEVLRDTLHRVLSRIISNDQKHPLRKRMLRSPSTPL